jgi:sporulation protein YlmC with PRC-barrel domain
MNKTLILLSFLVLVAFSGGVVYSHADQPISQSISTNRLHDFREVTRTMVKDSQGQYVGRITDLVIEPDGRISFAVLSRFEMDGRDARLVAVPFSALSFDDKYLVLDTTSDKLASAPLFNRSYLKARSWAEDSNRYFGLQPSWGEGKEGTACEKAPGMNHQISMTKGWNRPYDATEIIGTQVKDSQGEEVGKIDDLVFDEEGRISFAVIGYGGFLGMGQNLVAVPVNSLSNAEEPRHFVLDATKEKIQAAPLFSKKTLDEPGWAEGIHRYFGQQPSWTKEK